MAVALVNQWTLAAARNGDFEVATGPVADNWLVAAIAWSVNDGSTQTATVADLKRNLWQLCFSSTTAAFATNSGPVTNSALGQTEMMNVQIWVCPRVHYEGWPLLYVYAALNDILAPDIGAICINVFELSGMGNGTLTVDSVTLATANAATAFSIAAPAPSGGVDVVMVAAANTDNNAATQTFTAVGWTTLSQVSQNKTVSTHYFNPDVRLTTAWRETTAAQTATWTSSAACNWAGVVVAFRQTGIAPAQPNPGWPATQFLVGLGVQAGTPPPAVRWTDQTSRLLDWKHLRGVPYELGKAQSEASGPTIRNDDGAYSPRTAGALSATAAGTTSTLVTTATPANIDIGDFFQLKTASGQLKEYTVFQVASLLTSGGTTTISFKKADEAFPGVALAATAAGDQYSGIPIDVYIPYQVRMTWQGRTFAAMAGSLLEFQSLWENPHWGEVDAVGYDSLAPVGRVAADSPLRTFILSALNATHYWPLDDPQPAAVAQNIGSATTQLVPTVSKFGAGAGTAQFGVSTQGLATSTAGSTTSIFGDNGSGWQLTGLTTANLNAKQGTALVGVGNDFPPISKGVTVAGMWYQPSADLTALQGGTSDGTVMIVRSANPGGGSATLLKLSINHVNGHAQITVWDRVTKVSTTTDGGLPYSQPSWTPWAVAFNQTNWYLYIYGSVVASGTCNLPASFNIIDVSGEADSYITGFFCGMEHAHIAVLPMMISDTEAVYLYTFMTNAGNATSEILIRHVMQASGWLGARAVTPSNVSAEFAQSPSGSLVDQAAAIASYEDGLFFADAAGNLQWRSDQRMSLQTSSATVGENVAGGEFPYLPEFGQKALNHDLTYLYTAVQVNNTLNVPGTSAPATTSIIATAPQQYPKYGTITLNRPTNLYYTYLAWYLAWWLLNSYSTVRQRAETLVFEAVRTSSGSLWPFLLSVEVGDVITVNRRPVGAPAISMQCRVLQIEVQAVPPEEYTVTLTLGIARPQTYVCNDPVLGIVGNGVLGVT